MNGNENINANDQTPDDTTEIFSNAGPAPLDSPGANTDTAENAADYFYEENADRTISLSPNAIWVVLLGATAKTGSFMLNIPVGPNGETPLSEEDHYPDELLERVLPLEQDDASINIGFLPKVESPLNAPGVIVYPYMDSNQNIVANGVIVVVVVPGLSQPIVSLLTDDLLELQATMDIQHAQAYVADARKGEILELVIPLHSGYPEGPNDYATAAPEGQEQIYDPNSTGDNSLRYFVFSNAPTGVPGAIERNLIRSWGNEIVHSPTVVVLRPEPAYLKPKLYLLNWRKLLT